MSRKRDRLANYTVEETEKLVSLIDIKKNVIENKNTDRATSQIKEDAWRAIEIEFNACSFSEVYRSSRNLKMKYEALKKNAKKRASSEARTSLTPMEQKILDIYSVSGKVQQEDFSLDETHNSDSNQIIPEILLDEPVLKKTCHDQNNALINPKKEVEVSFSKNLKKTSSIPTSDFTNPVEEDEEEEEEEDIFVLQKKLIEEELEEKMLKNRLLKNEIKQKEELFLLEKRQMLLKIDILEKGLEIN